MDTEIIRRFGTCILLNRLQDNSREFCKKMVSGEQGLPRKEDIEAAGALRAVNPGLRPEWRFKHLLDLGFLYKGGATVFTTLWIRQTYLKKDNNRRGRCGRSQAKKLPTTEKRGSMPTKIAQSELGRSQHITSPRHAE